MLLTFEGEQTDVARNTVETDLIDLLGATGAEGECHRLPDGRWLLGLGDARPEQLRTAGACLSRALRGGSEREHTSDAAVQIESAVLPVSELSEDSRTALVIGLMLGSYRFIVSRRQPPPPGVVHLVTGESDLPELVHQVEAAGALAAATGIARDLANAPSDRKTPTWLVETAARLASEFAGLTSEIWPVQRLTEEGFGGLLAVGGGSARPPALLRLEWSPDSGTEHRHLVLVGKGITFDTGGISIKPADGMHLMRTDMAGGAAVIGAMVAIARLRLPVRVTALVPAAENHVSGSAYRPGDIVRHYNGTTTEVVNTDAEGRMVLADALGYAVRELAPDLIVDVATLTGAMKVSLGMRTAGLFASDDDLAAEVLTASDLAGEPLWRMPLLDHVAEGVSSDIADVRQVPPGPSGIGAALFLREFTGGLPWAHLDIAGPARCEKPYNEVVPGASGFAARTLVELARRYATA
ncbi:MAG TPA: leucyl aminopeptidase [Pseudonocardia sp.]|nr:leucyl aminopeptidase [Pseudonocardia sp.]